MTAPTQTPRVRKLQRQFLDPVRPVDEAALQQIQLLAAFLLFLIGISILYAVILLTVPQDNQAADLNHRLGLVIMVTVGLGSCYFLARSGYPRYAAWIVIIVLSMAIYIIAIPILPVNQNVSILIYLLVPIFLAQIFLPLRTAGLIASLNLAIIAGLPALDPELQFIDIVMFPLMPVAVLSGLFLFMASVRQQSARASETEAFYRRFLAFNPNLVATIHNGIIENINTEGLRLLGSSSEHEIIGKPIKKFIPLHEHASVSARLVRLQNENEFALRTVEQLTRVDGSQTQVEITAIPLMLNGRLVTQLIAHPVPERPQLSERVESLVELMADFAYLLDVDLNGAYHLRQVRGNIEHITGYSLDEIVTWADYLRLVHPDDRSALRQHIQAVLDGHTKVSELRLLTRGGETRWIRDYSQPKWDRKHEHVVGVNSIVQNVTDYFRTEISLQTHALQQAVVAELGQRALIHQSDALSLVEEAVTLMAQVLDVEYADLLEISEDKSRLTFKAGVGWDPTYADELPLHEDTPSALATYTLKRHEPVIVTDFASEKRFRPTAMLEYHQIASSICVVIHGQDQPLGVLEVHSPLPRSFSLDDINFMQSIANVLAAFTEFQRTRAAEREQRLFAEALREIAAALNSTLELDEVLDRMLQHLGRVLPFDATSIMLVEKDFARVIRHTGFEKHRVTDKAIFGFKLAIQDSPILTSIARTGQPITIPDVRDYSGWITVKGNDWIRGYVGAPILFEGELLGIINADSATPGIFTESHAQRLLAFANQASIAIRNARRATDLEQRVTQRTAELDVERSRLQMILDATGEGIFYTEGTLIQYANAAFRQMTGYTSSELAGQPTARVVKPAERDDEQPTEHVRGIDWLEVQEALQRDRIWRSEVTIIRRDQSKFDAALTVSRAEMGDDLLRTVTVVRDISREKMLEAQKSRFIANAAHELRTPIASLNTRMYMLRRDPANTDKHMEILGRVVDRMNRLVEDLLDISRFENGVISLRQRDVVVQTLISEVIAVQEAEAERKLIQLRCDMPNEPLRIFVDPERFVQVITNLISNAVNYTPEGGDIHVFVKTGHNGRNVNILVHDNGVGIEPEHLPQIFQPFFRITDRVRGTGLGLSIAQEIIKLHSGEITVESEVGQGSTFCVSLPLLPEVTDIADDSTA